MAFAIAAGAGVLLLVVRRAVRGDADPFNDGWPLDLQTGSLALTLLIGLPSGRPFAAALGLYGGLVGAMLVDGHAEYPVASLIALAVHGLLPALAGALCVVGLQRWCRRARAV